jgi:hypothetical protein
MTQEPAPEVRPGLVALGVFVVQMVVSIMAWRWIAGADYMSANEFRTWFFIVGPTLGVTAIAGLVLARPRSWRLGVGLFGGSMLALLGSLAWMLADALRGGH